jgi:hypothetical protein
MRRKIISLALALITVYALKAQEDSTAPMQFKLGMFYNSHLNYYGRTDSLKSSGFFPTAEWWLDDHFYLTASPVFVHNNIVSFDYAGTVATAGYQFRSKNEHWAGNVIGVKPFYKKSSQLVQSALKAQGAFTISSLNKILNLTAGADIKWSDKMDYGVTGGLDHIFRKQFENNLVLVIDPSVYVYAGTQQFTNSYLKKTSFLIFSGPDQVISEQVNKFNILSYELSLPVVLAQGRFQFILTPSFAMPQNLVKVQGRPDLSENGKNLFYVVVGVKAKL